MGTLKDLLGPISLKQIHSKTEEILKDKNIFLVGL